MFDVVIANFSSIFSEQKSFLAAPSLENQSSYELRVKHSKVLVEWNWSNEILPARVFLAQNLWTLEFMLPPARGKIVFGVISGSYLCI